MEYELRRQWIRKRIQLMNSQHVSFGERSDSLVSDIHPAQFKMLPEWTVDFTDFPNDNAVTIDIFEKTSPQKFTILVLLKN